MDDVERAWRLIEEADELPEGLAKTSICREAVRFADLSSDKNVQFASRLQFVESAFYSGEVDEMFVAVSWCISAFDNEPDRWDPSCVVRAIDKALACVTDFPNISRTQIEQLMDDSEKRYRVTGKTIGDHWLERCRIAFLMGDYDLAKEQYKKLEKDKPDWSEEGLSLFRSDYYMHLNEHEKAYEHAKLLLADQQSYFYRWIAPMILNSLVALGKLEEAQICHEVGYPAARDNPKYFSMVGKHLAYLAGTGQLDAALKIFERHIQIEHTIPSMEKIMNFSMGASLLFEGLNKSGVETLKLNIPESSDAYSKSESYSTKALGEHFHKRGFELASKFDQRNGNKAVTERMQFLISIANPKQ